MTAPDDKTVALDFANAVIDEVQLEAPTVLETHHSDVQRSMNPSAHAAFMLGVIVGGAVTFEAVGRRLGPEFQALILQCHRERMANG